MRPFSFVLFVVALAACEPRGDIRLDPAAAETGSVESVFIGTTRGDDPETKTAYARERSAKTRFVRLDVAIPPERTPGTITWTRPNRPVDPQHDFLTTEQLAYSTPASFRTDLARDLSRMPRRNRETFLFVHGFNTNFAEGAYRLAQLGHDLELPGTLVHYSWPSRAHALAYAYDRDSALFARDGLEQLLDEVDAAGSDRLVILAHSMGAGLTMETLRQIAIRGDGKMLRKIEAVILISPDIDLDVFRAQAWRVGPFLDNPIFIFTSRKDRALALSARLSGETNRLGNLRDVSELGDLRVTLLDTTAFSTGSGHFNVGNSPALLSILGRISDVETILAADQATRTGLLPGAVLTVQSATQIVLSPVTAISGLEP